LIPVRFEAANKPVWRAQVTLQPSQVLLERLHVPLQTRQVMHQPCSFGHHSLYRQCLLTLHNKEMKRKNDDMSKIIAIFAANKHQK